jgi:hypothetical protein
MRSGERSGSSILVILSKICTRCIGAAGSGNRGRRGTRGSLTRVQGPPGKAALSLADNCKQVCVT